MMAIISIIFITSLQKFNLFGHARNLKKIHVWKKVFWKKHKNKNTHLTLSSNVNHIIHRVSMRKKGSVISGTSSSSIFVPFVVVLNTWNRFGKGNEKWKQKMFSLDFGTLWSLNTDRKLHTFTIIYIDRKLIYIL